MKIIKYLLMLAVLAAVAISVYIYTRPSEYTFQHSKRINAPKSVVYSYLNNYKTWPLWFNQNAGAVRELSETNPTDFSWNMANGKSGLLKTVELSTDSITQLLTLEGLEKGDMLWKLDGRGKETELHWNLVTNLGFSEKATLFFKGDSNKDIETHFEVALQRLDSLIVAQMKDYSVQDDGVVTFGGFYYVYTEITCAQDDMKKELEKAYPRLNNFLKSQNAKVSGSTFHIYKVWDEINKTTSFAACMPTNDTISIAPESNILKALFPKGLYHKTTLKGDYANLFEAWTKSDTAVSKLQHKEDASKYPLEVYAVDPENSENPALWVTYILKPLKPLDTIN